MAGCYHDKQDFKSDLNIEVAREGDILQEGHDLDEIKCHKNPGHRGFIPFKDLTLEHLPFEHKNIEMLDKIKKMGNIVVRLVVEKMKNGRRIKEAGSGSVFKYNNEYSIYTNNHVVKTDVEVKNCTVEFHYNDSNDRSSVLTSRGVELDWTCPYKDITAFRFHPVPDYLHQLEWMGNKLPSIIVNDKNNQIVTVKILLRDGVPPSPQSFFSPLNLNIIIGCIFVSLPDGSISYLKSSYFKFQPIPSNIQELTSLELMFSFFIYNTAIEIHKDEDDGNSRVIPGSVLKFGDDFVVKISETIFQDEVKKCRLVWNGEVICRGTRLYFQQVKTSEVYSGIDLERAIEQGRDSYWVFEFHPILKHLEDMLKTTYSSNMCCIGHPHGAIKMVTFGRELGQSTEHFDNQYRRISKPGKDCKCKKVGCLKYSCKTCPGSSGSPVSSLSEAMDCRICFVHFLGERVERILPNFELIENQNIAWFPL